MMRDMRNFPQNFHVFNIPNIQIVHIYHIISELVHAKNSSLVLIKPGLY